MKKVFEYDNYKKFVNERIKSMPRRGHGQFRRLADHLRVHYTFVSQVFKGTKDLSAEQALSVCQYLALNELETDYFMALVERERAGTEALRTRTKEKLQLIRDEASQIGRRLAKAATLSEEQRAIFYSSWYYSATRLLTSIPQYRSVDKIARRLGLPGQLVAQVADFLLAASLCVEEKGGDITMGPSRTHIPADSPLVGRHHTNWRLKAFERFGKLKPEELIFTSPLTISREGSRRTREILFEAIEEINKIVEKSEPDTLACLNIDWFEVL